MDKIFLIFLFLTISIIPIIICIPYTRKVKNDVASSIEKCLIFAIITILANGFFALALNETFSYIMQALYLFSFDVTIIYILQYTQQYTLMFDEIAPFKTGCFVLAFIDGLSLFLNTFFHHSFTLKNVTFFNFNMYHVDSKNIFYYLHYIFAYLIVACIVSSFINKSLRVPSFYRKKYLPILAIICLIIVLNLICNISQFPIDLSLPFFAFAAILICHLTLYRTPSELIDKTLSIVVTEMNSAVICFDITNKCVYANEQALNISGSISNISDCVFNWIDEYNLKKLDSLEWSEKKVFADKTHYFDVEYRKLFDKKNEYIGFFLNLIDITDKHLAYEKEKYLATHDVLTGLYNKDYFAKKASELLKSNTDTEWLLLSSNIKDFKLINDLFGLEKGNEVLKMEADLLKAKCGKDVVYGRTGGDKFTLCIPKARFSEQTFIDAIHEMGEIFNNDLYHLHIYIGVYEITDCNEDIFIMWDKANLAIKTLGESYDKVVAYYNDTIFNDTLLEKRLVGEFDKALLEKQFCIFLQPQMTPDGKMLGAEALVRWQHPERGLIFPGDFIAVFEKTGLIYRLDKYVWELAVQKLAEWQKNGHNELYISVNISTKDFYYMDVYDTITSLVEKYGITPATLKLEITETAIMTGMSGELDIINQFRDYGFQVEIDDFGAGYSSLNTLKDMDVDVIKIDMGFLRTTKPDRIKRSMAILNTIIDLTKTLGLSVITEGVETKEQVTELTQMGCNIYQGYYFSKPIPVEQFEEKYMQ